MTTVEDWLFPKEFIDSVHDNKSKAKEYRNKSVWFIEDLGKKLNAERKVISTASVYFHRFFVFHTFEQHERFFIAVACMFLAAKVEEFTDPALRINNVVRMFFQLKYSKDKVEEVELREVVKRVTLAERLILNTLNFDLNVQHPYTFCTAKMKELKMYIPEERKTTLAQNCINLINDSYRSTFCLRYSPQTLALAFFYLATKQISLQPLNPHLRGSSSSSSSGAGGMLNTSSTQEISWLELIEKDIEIPVLRDICLEMLDVYDTLLVMNMKLPDKQRIQQAICWELGGGNESNNRLGHTPESIASLTTNEEENEGLLLSGGGGYSSMENLSSLLHHQHTRTVDEETTSTAHSIGGGDGGSGEEEEDEAFPDRMVPRVTVTHYKAAVTVAVATTLITVSTGKTHPSSVSPLSVMDSPAHMTAPPPPSSSSHSLLPPPHTTTTSTTAFSTQLHSASHSPDTESVYSNMDTPTMHGDGDGDETPAPPPPPSDDDVTPQIGFGDITPLPQHRDRSNSLTTESASVSSAVTYSSSAYPPHHVYPYTTANTYTYQQESSGSGMVQQDYKRPRLDSY